MPVASCRRLEDDSKSTIKATAFLYNFDADHIALITIDMQRDFCEVDGYATILGNDVKTLAPCIR